MTFIENFPWQVIVLKIKVMNIRFFMLIAKKKSTWMIYLLYNFIKFHMYILVHPNQENIYLKSVLKSINNCADDFKYKSIVHFWNVKLYTNLFLLSFWSRKCVSWYIIRIFSACSWRPLICIDWPLSIRLLDEAYFNRILQNVSRRSL